MDLVIKGLINTFIGYLCGLRAPGGPTLAWGRYFYLSYSLSLFYRGLAPCLVKEGKSYMGNLIRSPLRKEGWDDYSFIFCD